MAKKFKDIVLTGDRPTGPLHLGHYVGSLLNRVKMQDEHDDVFYMIADMQALTDNADDTKKVHDNVMEVLLDNLAVGVDPKKTVMFVQSMVPQIAELMMYFMNLVTVNQLQHNPTIKTEIKDKGMNESIPLGFLAYPVSQAADILFCKGNIVPVGADQMPVLEQGNEIVKKFNAMYGEVFAPIKGVVGDHGRLVGTDGKSKASKSMGNAIMLSDSDKDIEKKVMGMYTDPNRISKTDPGKVEGNVVFEYLDVFDDRVDEIEDLKKRYRAGGDEAPGDVDIKKRLAGVLKDLIGPIRERREELAKDPKKLMKILTEGNKRANEVAAETLVEVKQAMGVDYFG